MSKLYLAYGSNLNVRQMRRRCSDAVLAGTAWIPDYHLLFRGSKTGSYLTIEPKKGSRVPVGVWKISRSDERNLDIYEGFPSFYVKQGFRILLTPVHGKGEQSETDAFAYTMRTDRPLGIPTEMYMEACREGYRKFGFDEAFLDQALADSCS